MARKKKKASASLFLLLLFLLSSLVGLGYRYRDQLTPPAPSVASAAIDDATRPVRIATWNIRQLGGSKTTDVRQIAKTISDNSFDVLAIQEVFRDGRGVDALLNALGHPWRGTRMGSESRSGERLTFIYRGDRISESGSAHDLPGATDRVFDRVPYTASFRCGQFDWDMVTVHLSWGDEAQRQYEMRTLANLIAAKAGGQREKDIIVLGDFNEQKSRPNLHFMNAVGWQTIVKKGTNLSGKERYDLIIFSPKYTPEYTGQYDVVAFDEVAFGNDDREAATAVSNHRPVWADFHIQTDDD